MKLLIAVSLVLSLNSAFAQTIVCSTGPSDVFIIDLKSETEATVTYQRYPFFGAEILPLTQEIQGCNPAQYVSVTSDEVYIECDGDAGYISLSVSQDKISGTVHFPEGNIAYDKILL